MRKAVFVGLITVLLAVSAYATTTIDTESLPAFYVGVPANFQIQVSGGDVNVYNFAMAHLRTLPGLASATPQQINPSGTSYVLVSYTGGIQQLAAALAARGWIVETSGTVVRIKSSSSKPPALPPPPAPVQPRPPAAQPAPQPTTNQTGGRQE